jgi:hypothetical protein
MKNLIFLGLLVYLGHQHIYPRFSGSSNSHQYLSSNKVEIVAPVQCRQCRVCTKSLKDIQAIGVEQTTTMLSGDEEFGQFYMRLSSELGPERMPQTIGMPAVKVNNTWLFMPSLSEVKKHLEKL